MANGLRAGELIVDKNLGDSWLKDELDLKPQVIGMKNNSGRGNRVS